MRNNAIRSESWEAGVLADDWARQQCAITSVLKVTKWRGQKGALCHFSLSIGWLPEMVGR